ncbi:MAG: acetoacetate--CoA ligase [Bdellovibrionales bacterium]|nr:acetoacetate--CoA ligase [Bdellovibrionales bacterium]
MSVPLWSPTPERIGKANITRFIEFVNRGYSAKVSSFEELLCWSIESKEKFWPAVWEFTGIKSSAPWSSVLSTPEDMLESRWFEGAKLNFAENLLRFKDNKPAIIAWNEAGSKRELTYAQLSEQVRALASVLRNWGVKPGDRIAGFMPNVPEAIIAMLAASSLGAIWSSCSPDFGFKGVMDRFGQIEPKVLFCADGYFYNGKTIDSLERVTEIAGTIKSIEHIVVCPFVNETPKINNVPNASLLPVLLAEADDSASLIFEQLPFDHPLFIMYSSGTTGIPKCIVHGAGGTLIQHAKEHQLHTDITREDRLFYFSTCGWMMWNWLVSGLFSGATLMLYDGSPMYRDGKILFDFAEQEGITVFGTSAKFIAAIEKAGLTPKTTHQLKSLRAILSTGSTLLPESFDYVYRDIKSDIHLASITGGTDIISCFMLGNPTAPVYRSEIQTRGLGMDVKIFNSDGEPVVGERGELCCVSTFPSMPIYFWNDPDNAKYKASYFEAYDNVWRHGDWAQETEHGGFIMFGRSDATLNPQGVRIGTSEIYNQVEQLDEIVDSIVVGQKWEGDERVILFVVLRGNAELTDELRAKIKKQIRENTTPRHVPAKILQVSEIPRTISGKIVELAVKNVLEGMPVKNTDALANPHALDQFKNIPELQTA